ncbi:class III lanthipeptide [Paractinoplanes brasiliensis]|uniref:Uncharacterized protein n=1 Tax=Paractinoplanes brasiliensis TaxID=52695 RepID=A0A4R6JAD0_9ACTN|nr:class III lanthipeptide [Actinoplanes brasiliensis]TDO32630.1 hypothetical protein C8E87_8100 [Actinoplanes brasiliensis]
MNVLELQNLVSEKPESLAVTTVTTTTTTVTFTSAVH